MPPRLLPFRTVLAPFASVGRAPAGWAIICLTAFGPMAEASDLRMTVEKPHFTCERTGIAMSRVVYRGKPDAIPVQVLPCCDGLLGCAQFLSTSTVVHPPHRLHT